ncbi:hypothetical protein HB836_16155 [Listeria booriae]|uniref:Uncharacterized protein n=2 Tax=Listeria booriae TaxID=1552123 RepID=A0A841YRV8_9LIST|nr:hypothetical protein [Listeria booriae]MBC1403126.1 hypothetical protein [Listeria booriae]
MYRSKSSISSLMVHGFLVDLIKNVYSNHSSVDERERMTRFWIEFHGKELKSKDCSYASDTSSICIYNFSRPGPAILLSCINAAAHHVDFVIRNETRNDDSFFSIYHKLLLEAFRLQMLTPAKIMAIDSTKDLEQLEKRFGAIDEWLYETKPYKDGLILLKCRAPVDKKDVLKKAKYKFSTFEKVWIKEVQQKQVQMEKDFLKRFFPESDMLEVPFHDLSFYVVYFVSLKNGRIHYDTLKEMGYQYEAYDLGRFTWNKQIVASKWREEEEKLSLLKGLKIRTIAK